METYKQCKLRREDTVQTAWIPSRIAVEGNTVNLREEDGEWSEGWVVVSVYDPALSWKYLNERSRDYINARKASDI